MRTALLICGLAAATPSTAACQAAAPSRTDDQLYQEAAQRAWQWLDRNYQPTTGLIRATDHYALVTTWDIASGLLGLFSANELGLLPTPEYDRRMTRALQTLATMPLYDNTAYSRFYSAETGQMYGRNEQPSTRGYGWSATDLGRLLTALKVISSNHGRFQPAVERIVNRLDYGRLVRDGYLWGEDVRPGGRVSQYPEGRIGYEQYAAQGFALWGHRAERALRVTENAVPVQVEGVRLMGDRRGRDRVTSEPFVLAALESGLWGEELSQLSRGVLQAQEARWRRTQQITIVSEDALPVQPYYFYYYTVVHDGHPWAIDAQASMQGISIRPWISTKAAFAWHALYPSDYTRLAVRAVATAHARERDWSSGIYEQSNRPTGGSNINTAAVILESALYRKRGSRLYQEQPAG